MRSQTVCSSSQRSANPTCLLPHPICSHLLARLSRALTRPQTNETFELIMTNLTCRQEYGLPRALQHLQRARLWRQLGVHFEEPLQRGGRLRCT